MQSEIYHNSQSDNLSYPDILNIIKTFLEQDKNGRYKLTIGTDSESKFDKKTGAQLELITAIVLYKIGYGGKYFWTRKIIKNVKTLREKIYQEVLLSIDVAKQLVPDLKEKLNGNSTNYDLEIHIDVGEKGETREMLREVIGIVAGNGFVAKTKPDSYAASNVADRHV